MNLCKQKCHKTCDTYLAGLWLSSSLKTYIYIYNIKKICLKCSICVRLMWEGKKESKHKEYRLNWRILIEKPERRSKHVLKANVASTVTRMSSIDIPQYSEFYVLLVKLAMLYNKRSWHFQFPFFFSFYSRGGGMLRVRIDRRTNICSPTVFLCLKQSLFLPHHKWLKLVGNSNPRMFF